MHIPLRGFLFTTTLKAETMTKFAQFVSGLKDAAILATCLILCSCAISAAHSLHVISSPPAWDIIDSHVE